MSYKNKDNVEQWDRLRNKIESKKGGWVIGDAVYNHGYRMMQDLVGSSSYFQVLVLNITGRLPSKNITKWLEASFICLSWPDPRIWCNQIGALAGTIQASCPSAVSGGMLAADSRMYGAGTMRACMEFIVKAGQQANKGKTISEIVDNELALKAKQLKSKPVISGYARPIASGDERVTAMQRVGRDLGFSVGHHENIAIQIHNELHEKYDDGINVAGYCAALLSDFGYTPLESERIYATWVNSGIHACYAEAADKPELTFLPMRCDDIDYHGPTIRKLPKSQ
jgi:citrate synthase